MQNAPESAPWAVLGSTRAPGEVVKLSSSLKVDTAGGPEVHSVPPMGFRTFPYGRMARVKRVFGHQMEVRFVGLGEERHCCCCAPTRLL